MRRAVALTGDGMISDRDEFRRDEINLIIRIVTSILKIYSWITVGVYQTVLDSTIAIETYDFCLNESYR